MFTDLKSEFNPSSLREETSLYPHGFPLELWSPVKSREGNNYGVKGREGRREERGSEWEMGRVKEKSPDGFFLSVINVFMNTPLVFWWWWEVDWRTHNNNSSKNKFPFEQISSLMLSIRSRKTPLSGCFFPGGWGCTGGAASAGSCLLPGQGVEGDHQLLVLQLKQRDKYYMLMDACQQRERGAFNGACQTQKPSANLHFLWQTG